jgi:hypothetical protein
MQKMYVSYVVEMPDGISERGVERVVDKVQMELHSAVGLPFKLVSVFGPIPAAPMDTTRDPVVLDTMCEMPLYTMRLAQLDTQPFNNSRAAMEIAASDVMVMGLLKSLEEAGKKAETVVDGDVTGFLNLLGGLHTEIKDLAEKVMAK